MTNASGHAGTLRGWRALIAWVKSVARLFRVSAPCSMDRAGFERIALDLDLSPPELYGQLTGCRVAADALGDGVVMELAASPQFAKRLRAIQREHRAAAWISLPIAPCC
jgi:hypothetical protein